MIVVIRRLVYLLTGSMPACTTSLLPTTLHHAGGPADPAVV